MQASSQSGPGEVTPDQNVTLDFHMILKGRWEQPQVCSSLGTGRLYFCLLAAGKLVARMAVEG